MLRKAAIKDCEKIYNLICELENTVLPFSRFKDIFSDQLNSSRYYCLVCERDNDVIGVLNLRFEKQLHHAECIAEIMEFIVDHGFRTRGIGKSMLERACQVAKEYGCSQIEVDCSQLRIEAHRFYCGEGMSNSHYKFSKLLTGERK